MVTSQIRSRSFGGLVATSLLTLTSFSAAQSEAQAEATTDAASVPVTETAQPAAEGEKSASDEAEAAAPTGTEVDPYAEAKERVGRAEKLFEDGNYDAALTEFERAYETMLGHPARNYVLFNIGKCQEKLYRYDAAVSSYKSYLEMSDASAEDRPTVEAKIELLEGLLGTLEISITATTGPAPAKYEVWVDGRLIGEDNRRFSIPGGNHQVEVRAEGFEVQNQEVQLPARSSKKLDFALVPLAKEYKGLSPTYFWTAGGLAVAAGAVGGAFGLATITKRNDLDNKAPELVTEEDQDKLKSLALTADLFFIGAGVCATTAVILAFITDWSEENAEESPVQVKAVGFAPTSDGAFLNIRGAF